MSFYFIYVYSSFSVSIFIFSLSSVSCSSSFFQNPFFINVVSNFPIFFYFFKWFCFISDSTSFILILSIISCFFIFYWSFLAFFCSSNNSSNNFSYFFSIFVRLDNFFKCGKKRWIFLYKICDLTRINKNWLISFP